MALIRAFPFLALVVLAYNVLLVFGDASPGAVAGEARLPSGALWSITTGDVLVIVALALLAVEVVSAGSRSRTVARINNALSLVLFLVCVAEFLLVPACGRPEFLFITLMTLVDVAAGYTVPARPARPALAGDGEVIGGIQ
jgi:voltage-gated potassium channel Kch